MRGRCVTVDRLALDLCCDRDLRLWLDRLDRDLEEDDERLLELDEGLLTWGVDRRADEEERDDDREEDGEGRDDEREEDEEGRDDDRDEDEEERDEDRPEDEDLADD